MNNPTKIKTSIRIKVVLDFIYDFLKKYFKLTEEDCKNYLTKLSALSEEKQKNLKIEIHSREGSLKAIESEFKDISLGMTRQELKPTVKKYNEERVDELVAQKLKVEEELENLRGKVTDPTADRLTLEQFLNLSKKAETIVKSADAVKKDAICRLIFLNLEVDGQKVTSYRLKPPFDTMLKTHVI